jgi:gliding motility-associated-like protein
MYKSILTAFAASVLSAYGFAAVTETNPIETSEGFISALAPPPAPVFDTAFYTPASSCNGVLVRGSITALTSGGNGTVTYSLSGSFTAANTTGVFNNLLPGNYSIVATDSLGFSIPIVTSFDLPTIHCDTSYRSVAVSSSSDTVCLTTRFGTNPAIVSGCSGSNISANGIAFAVTDSCVIFPATPGSLPAPFMGDEICLIQCDTIYGGTDSTMFHVVCDTSRIIYYAKPTPDSSLNYLPSFGGISVCVDTTELVGNSLFYSMEMVPRFGIFNQNSFTSNCFTYIPAYNQLDSAVVVVCDDLGVCDTSLFVFVPHTTIDTIRTYETILCIDTLEITGVYDTINTCDGLGTTTSFGSVSFGTGACVSITPNLVLGTDTSCIVICNNTLGICDTTIIISYPEPVTDTMVLFPNGSSISTCLNTTELPGTSFTYSVEITAVNGAVSNNDSCFRYLPIVNAIDRATVTICDEYGFCDTTHFIYIPAQSIDTIYRGIPKSGATDTTCLNTPRTGGPYSINSCTGTDGTYDGVLFNKFDSCVVYPFNILTLSLPFTGDTACVILCDTVAGVLACDTNIIIYYPIPEPDTIVTLLPSSGSAVSVCVDDTEILGVPTNFSICSAPQQGVLQKSINSCYTYNPVRSGLDTACAIVCDNQGICDTTYFIFVPPVTTDTIYTQDSTVCVDTTELPGRRTSVSTCDGANQTSNGGTVALSIDGCVTISPIYTVITDTTCVVICNAQLGICDTTLIISVKRAERDTLISCIPRDGRADQENVSTTELLGDMLNTSVFTLPQHGQFTITNDTTVSYQTSPFPILDTVMVSYCDEYNFCDTFVFVYIPPMNTEIRYMQGAGVICLDTSEMPGMKYTHSQTCDGSGMTRNGGTVVSVGGNCVQITPDFTTSSRDTTCLILCDSTLPLCECDTTYVVSFEPSTPDTFAILLPKGTNTADTCLTTQELFGNTYTYRRLGAPTPHGPVTVHNDTCINYVQTSTTKYLDTARVLICDEYGSCDTTIIIYVPSPDADTLLVGPIVPSANTDTCVVLESTFMTGTHIGTCDGTGTSSGGVPITITGLCVRYPAPSPVFNGDTACIIVCDTIMNLIVCDTTLIVYLPDTTPPTVVCKNDTIYLTPFGTASLDTSYTIDTIFDNTLIHSVWISQTTFTCIEVGINNVTMYAQDTNRNIDSCVSRITVLDTLAPIIVCRNITIQLDSNGEASISATDVDGGTSDNCSLASLSINQTSFNCSHIGVNQITLTAVDVNGNVSTCQATVTVEDNIAPIIYCPTSSKDIVVRNTTCSVLVEDYRDEVSAWDNCLTSGVTFTQSPAPGTSVSVFTDVLTITITGTDLAQNTSSCSFDIAVRCVQELDIPQFISPNSDGQNDTWEIPGLSQYPENVVKVFNRWGTLVFEQKGYVTGWDGSANVSKGANQLLDNKMLPEGTYYYLIDLNDDSFEPYVGYLQIKR